MDKLAAFVKRYAPKRAAAETGVDATEISAFAQDLAEASPAVIWHPGWMNARYKNSFYQSRTAYLISALWGSIGSKGGLPVANKPGDLGRKGLKKLTDLFPKPKDQRADGGGGGILILTVARACCIWPYRTSLSSGKIEIITGLRGTYPGPHGQQYPVE